MDYIAMIGTSLSGNSMGVPCNCQTATLCQYVYLIDEIVELDDPLSVWIGGVCSLCSCNGGDTTVRQAISRPRRFSTDIYARTRGECYILLSLWSCQSHIIMQDFILNLINETSVCVIYGVRNLLNISSYKRNIFTYLFHHTSSIIRSKSIWDTFGMGWIIDLGESSNWT